MCPYCESEDLWVIFYTTCVWSHCNECGHNVTTEWENL